MSKLIKYLEQLKAQDERGILADLRNGIKKTQSHRAWPHLAYFNGIGESHNARVVQTVAALFAHHPEISEEGNMGNTCYNLMSDDERNKRLDVKEMGPISRRFQHLLSSSRDEICDRVIRLVLHAKTQNIPINYRRLKQDLEYWSDSVKTAWAKQFWK